MNRNKFELSKHEYFICDVCGKSIKKEYANVSKSREDGTTKRCKKCDYLFRHKSVECEYLTSDESDIVLELVFNYGVTSINKLHEAIPNRSLNELCTAYIKLKLHNKQMTVFTQCIVCGKETEKNPAYFITEYNKFCSSKCYWEHKRSNAKTGRDSPFYNSIDTECSFCGKPINIIKYNYELKNRFGESNNFCSQECYWGFRRTHYVGDKSYWKNRKRPESTCEKIRNHFLKSMKTDDRLNTKIQLLVNDILDSMSVVYEREKVIGYYSIDNFIPEQNLCIEVMGDYWHANPTRYNEQKYKLSEKQCGWILRDKVKKGYLINHGYNKPLYLWEHDILNNPEVCNKLIQKFLESDGQLENYNSFNYCLLNNELRINSIIIVPYQYMKSSEYRNPELLAQVI
jgi:very-short-patch-repair endonuclease